jgi:hypothetical protein
MVKSCLHSSLCSGTNFSSHLKHSPSVRRLVILAGENYCLVPGLIVGADEVTALATGVAVA